MINFKLSILSLDNEKQSLTTLATVASDAPMLGMYMIAPAKAKTAKKTKAKKANEQSNSKAE